MRTKERRLNGISRWGRTRRGRSPLGVPPSPSDQIRTRIPHRVCSFVVLRDVRRLIKQIVAVRPTAKRQVNQSEDQTLKSPGIRPDQSRVYKPVDDPRNRDDRLASQDQGRTADSRAATSQLPISAIATKQDELNASQQEVSTAPKQEEVSTAPRQQIVSPTLRRRESPVPPQEKKRKSKSTCGSSHQDLPLITSCG